MKKLLLIPALILGTMAVAEDYKYEITPVVGYNISEGNIEIDNQKLIGLEAQYNELDYFLKPELSVLYTNSDYDFTSVSESTNIYRLALNGVYEYSKIASVTPLAKVGIGYETMSTHLSQNYDSPFLDAGIGAKIPFSNAIALKLEAVYMLKHNDNRWDNNLALLAGLNFAFGAKTQKIAPEPIAEPTPEPKPAVAPVIIDEDSDNDGVKNSMDKCPDSPANATVNESGCPIIVNLHINFENDSYKISAEADARVQKFADFLNMYKNYSAKITGYTDSRASASYNQKLSQNRANAVKDALIKKGVSADRITAYGMGENNPIADNSNEDGRAKNRRIEAELIKN